MEEALDKILWRIIFPLGIVLVIIHSIGVMNNFYNLIGWFDIPLHFLWGAFGALLFYWLVYKFPGYVNAGKNFLVTLVMVLGWVALGGVLWEFGEYFYDLVVYIYGFSAGLVQFSLDDTLADLVFNLFGALGIAVIMRLSYHKNGKKT